MNVDQCHFFLGERDSEQQLIPHQLHSTTEVKGPFTLTIESMFMIYLPHLPLFSQGEVRISEDSCDEE